MEEAKTPPSIIYSNNTFINCSNLLEYLHNIPPPRPANPNADQTPIQNVKNLNSDAIKSN